jgi:hypothetical protein
MRHIRTVLLAAAGGLSLVAQGVPAASAVDPIAIPSDFDGDGYIDLAIGVPGEATAETREGAGAVNVVYGGPSGLSVAGDQLWTQDSPGVPDESEAPESEGDGFGGAVASGDFNGDGYADLAIGADGENIEPSESEFVEFAGAVTVVYGSSEGLVGQGSQWFSESSFGAVPGDGAHFGSAMAAGDFDMDGFVDLAILSRPGSSETAVQVVYGGEVGLAPSGSHRINPATELVSGDVWGDGPSDALASGDLDGDGFADLAIGLPWASASGIVGAGAVVVVYGGTNGLDGAPLEVWSQDSPGVLGVAEPYAEIGGDGFGASVVTGRFDGDGFADLAIGVPGEDTMGTCDREEWFACHGAVNVLYGSLDGLSAAGNQIWHQGTKGVPGKPEPVDRFGAALAAADFDGDGHDELAIGSPDEALGSRLESAGSVTTIRGGASGLQAAGARLWTQQTPRVPGRAEAYDWFGYALAAADYGRTGAADLAIAVIAERVDRHEAAGYVNVLYGSSGGPTTSGSQGWSQDSPGVHGVSEEYDYFGTSLSP